MTIPTVDEVLAEVRGSMDTNGVHVGIAGAPGFVVVVLQDGTDWIKLAPKEAFEIGMVLLYASRRASGEEPLEVAH